MKWLGVVVCRADFGLEIMGSNPEWCEMLSLSMTLHFAPDSFYSCLDDVSKEYLTIWSCKNAFRPIPFYSLAVNFQSFGTKMVKLCIFTTKRYIFKQKKNDLLPNNIGKSFCVGN